MNSKTVVMSTRSLLSAATVACMLFAGNVLAKDYSVTIALHVSAHGLDLSQPADAQTFYKRLEHAAWLACFQGNRVDLVPLDHPEACYEKALGEAILSAKLPMLTKVYLANHTLQEAAARGIYVPVQIAAK